MNKNVQLNDKWTMYMAKDSDTKKLPYSLNSQSDLQKTDFLKLDVTVPNNFELELEKANILPEIFYGNNVLEVQNYEDVHLWYCKKFYYEKTENQKATLVFNGIDTFADIYLNGDLLGQTENMFITHKFDVTNLLKTKNEITVHIKPTALEAQKYVIGAGCNIFLPYNAASLPVRKAAHSFGWDIMPRAISGGIWRDVYLNIDENIGTIEEIYPYTVNVSENSAEVWTYFKVSPTSNIKNFEIKINAKCGDNIFSAKQKLWHTEGKIEIYINNPKIWWPKNMGEPNLYDFCVELWQSDKLCDKKIIKFGIRTVNLDRTSVTDENGNGEFKFIINGKPFFVLGTNWVPLDAFHSRDKKRLPKALQLLEESGCNMVRCWGGNVYEDHEFFDFCDSHGITVWQDFAMGCAIYPQNDDFCNRLQTEAVQIIKKLRHHTSLVLWAGDNECDVTNYWTQNPKDPNFNRLTRKILPEAIRQHDPVRDYLPSSPYIDEIAFQKNAYATSTHNCYSLPEDHLWGPRDYFKGDYYHSAKSHFASEIGYHGCPSPHSIRKFISPEKLWPPTDNDEWLIHAACMEKGTDNKYAYRIPLMVSQVKTLFGEIPDNLEDFSLASQISQAEAMKYFVERFRIGKWRRTGIIWWNLIDGWPQFSDAVVDYYYNKKLAFDYIKNSQTPLCLMIDEPQDDFLNIVVANKYLHSVDFSYTLTDLTDNVTVVIGSATVKENSAEVIDKIKFDSKKSHFYLIEWEFDGKKFKNHYISGKPPYQLCEYVNYAKKSHLIK